MSGRTWTPEEDARLRELYPFTQTRELPALLGRSKLTIKVRAANMHLRKDPEASMRRRWHPDEDAVLRMLYADTPTDGIAAVLGRSLSTTFQRARKLGIGKSEVYLASPAAGRTNGRQGIGTRFTKGHVPANKGLRRPGYAPGRMKETQFKKGQFPFNHDPDFYVLGALRVNADGYIDMRVSFEKGALGWKVLHRILWEDEHGPVPEGYALTFKDHDKLNVELANIEMISRADLARRNSIHNLPPELKGAITALGALKRRIRREEQNRGSAQPPIRNARGPARRGKADGHRARQSHRRRGAGDHRFCES